MLQRLLVILYQAPLVAIRRLFRAHEFVRWFALPDTFDEEWGVETAEIVPVFRLDAVGKHYCRAFRYQASGQQGTKHALDLLNVDYREFVFIDIGCGKGRVLLIAAQFPFRRVVGVEFSPQLVEECRANLDRVTKHPCCEIEVLCLDATLYDFPLDNLVLYFFNPFDSVVMQGVLDRLGKSLTEHPRNVWLIFAGSRISRALQRCEFLHVVSSDGGMFIYNNLRSEPSTANCRSSQEQIHPISESRL